MCANYLTLDLTPNPCVVVLPTRLERSGGRHLHYDNLRLQDLFARLPPPVNSNRVLDGERSGVFLDRILDGAGGPG